MPAGRRHWAQRWRRRRRCMARLWRARGHRAAGDATLLPGSHTQLAVNGGGAKSPMSREAEGTAKDSGRFENGAGREDLLVLAGESLMAKACWVEMTAVLLVGESEDLRRR